MTPVDIGDIPGLGVVLRRRHGQAGRMAPEQRHLFRLPRSKPIKLSEHQWRVLDLVAYNGDVKGMIPGRLRITLRSLVARRLITPVRRGPASHYRLTAFGETVRGMARPHQRRSGRGAYLSAERQNVLGTLDLG